jgi:ABC-2 type transport system permease protein
MNWTQLSTILWLRWRLSRNQFVRGGSLNAALQILGLICGVILCVGSGIAGLLAGALGLSKASPMITLVVWDIIIGLFLFIWFISVLAEIQRAESIDLARILHLPVSLQGVFVMNYIASLLTPSIIIFLPGTIGICLGLVWSKGLSMLWLLPLLLTFLFLLTAWAYCVRGWLVTVMVNPRKRRNIILIATMSIVLVGQLPNLYFNVFARHNRSRHSHSSASAATDADTDSHPAPDDKLPPAYIAAHKYAPPLWMPGGAMALAEGNPWPAIWGSLGAFLLGTLGLARAYQSTLRFYRGQLNKTASAKPQPSPQPSSLTVAQSQKCFLEKQLPWLPEQVAALSLAFFRSLSRAPEVKMALVTNTVVIFIVGAGALSNVTRSISESVRPFMGTGAVAITFFGLIQLMFNQFGYDREGFRALVLLPVSRHHVLLAKNLSFAPLAGVLGIILLALLTVLIHLPPLALLASCLQLVAMFLLLSIAANFFSILVPYRMTAGSIKATKPPAKTVLCIMLTQLFFPILMLPALLAPLFGLLSEKLGWLPAGPVNLLLSVGLLTIATALYYISLPALGRYLERREKDVLLIVSHEGE